MVTFEIRKWKRVFILIHGKTFQKFSECCSVNPEIMSSSEDSPVKGKAFEIHQRQTALDDHIKEIKDGKNNQDKVNKVKKG